jgi:hypothetical protein
MEDSRLKAQGSSKSIRGTIAAVVLTATLGADAVSAQDPVLSLRAKVVPAPTGGALTVTVNRWSTDAERAPLLAALSAPAPAPPPAAPAGRAAAGRGGRGGSRGAPPPTPIERLATAVKSAPTVGYIWGDGVTGYSIKYAWRSADRVVLVTDRRLGAHAPHWGLAASSGPAPEFTVLELHLAASGAGEGKSSLSTPVVVDAAASTLALDRFAAAPTLLKVTR